MVWVGWNPLARWRLHPCLPPGFVTIDAEFPVFRIRTAARYSPTNLPTHQVLVIAVQTRVMFRAVVAQPTLLAPNLLFETALS